MRMLPEVGFRSGVREKGSAVSCGRGRVSDDDGGWEAPKGTCYLLSILG